MPYKRNSIPRTHTEMGGGDGLIDPMRRKDRVLEGHEELMEIYATNSADPGSNPSEVPVPRVAGSPS